ncbi:nuclear transport factor 2 family protein [Oerskovia turbata]|uniref:Nuclear transport factor 2 family protein n=1 Tax=Oerskovia turbata TaxID=1713 RepID=A0A4Q1KXY3_9CELL|nr:nuclear transport factor 2 family protein [Oerskovia turbata]RXR24729.1 nuclear transport factor 2 family protein [Oerskovia turbata]RXR35067.1 nuclear transport factor 2 family protein [Oerskovia turbata]TGJ97131.1 nuclear transport factor 2 family protein [Actinotalea fermentans ATCC 43279 = JCM 9966 = DSM 3133]TGJ97133.1 nuclear transport factor 2 family protein [Actinotalea fermentans ATCC 43279 = JCM 9966 = DSM 3133]
MSLLAAEHALQAAQRAGDVDALDTLLHPRCVGVGPDGSVFSKDDDLESHRSGALRITRLEEESLDVREDAVSGVTRLVAAVEAIQGGVAVSARLVYTRLWTRRDERWLVLAATLAPAAEPASRDVGGTP